MGDTEEAGLGPSGAWSVAMLVSLAVSLATAVGTVVLWISYQPRLVPRPSGWTQVDASAWLPLAMGMVIIALVALGTTVYVLSHSERFSPRRTGFVVALGMATLVSMLCALFTYELIAWEQLALSEVTVATGPSGITALFDDKVQFVFTNGAEHSVSSVRIAAMLNLCATAVCVVAPVLSLGLIRSSTFKGSAPNDTPSPDDHAEEVPWVSPG